MIYADTAGPHDVQEGKNISSFKMCNIPLPQKLTCGNKRSSLSEGAFNWSCEQRFLADEKAKKDDTTWVLKTLWHDFKTLCNDFCETLSTTTNDKNFSSWCDMISDELSIDPKTRDEIKASNDVKKLSKKICEHQSFINFDILVKRLIPWLGSEQNKIKARYYEECFERLKNCRAINCSQMYPSVLTNHFRTIFIIDTNQDQYRIDDQNIFRLLLSISIDTDYAQILLDGVTVCGQSVIVRVQIPDSSLKMLLYQPLYPKKMKDIKDIFVKSYYFKDHEVVLKHWDILTNVSLPPIESSPTHEKQGKIIKSAYHQGEECMALVYPNQFSEDSEIDIKYIKYLEVLIRDHKEVPCVAIKGLYYPPEEGGLQKYPVVITEKLKSLEEITFPSNYDESDIDLLQISLLSNIASGAKRFERLNHKVKVFTDHILIQEDDAEYKAKFIPVYGDLFTDEIPSDQYSASISESLPHDDLLWMKEVILHILSHGGNTSHVEIPGQYILKNMIEQKWLSKDTQFRPHTYSELTDELQHLLGK